MITGTTNYPALRPLIPIQTLNGYKILKREGLKPSPTEIATSDRVFEEIRYLMCESVLGGFIVKNTMISIVWIDFIHSC